jgi:MarR family transcriptional regulator, organic hydroperoxide resistance regulator
MRSEQDQHAAIVERLRAFGAANSAMGRRFAKEQGMHPTDAAAIVEILEAERNEMLMTPARLAERIGLTAGATSTLVNRLEDAGHVVRRRDQSDRRLVGLHTTDRVHRDAEAFFAPIAERLDAVLAAHSSDQLDSFGNLLDALNAVMSGSQTAN